MVSGACLAEMGNHAVCLDTDEEKIVVLKASGLPIDEPGLHEVVHGNLYDPHLMASLGIECHDIGRGAR